MRTTDRMSKITVLVEKGRRMEWMGKPKRLGKDLVQD